MAKTEKTEQEHEEEEVEKLVKPSPKKKPPRTDRENRRIKTRDDDLSSKDKDLSMNYKDIGGSSRRVLMRYLRAFEVTEEAPESESAPEPKLPSEDEIAERAANLYGISDEDLATIMGSAEGLAIARKIIELRYAPLPPNWEPTEVFEHAHIRLKDRGRFRRHMKHWDEASFLKNITYFKERQLHESLTSGRDDANDYYEALLELSTEAFEDFKAREGRPLGDLREALHLLSDPRAEFTDTSDLEEAVDNWKHRLKKTPQATLAKLREEIDLALREDIPQDTTLYHWLHALKNLVHGATAMSDDTLDPRKVAASLRKGMSRHAQYRGVPGYEPRELLPDAPKWSRPDPREITAEDYSHILLKAVEWLNSDFLKVDLLQYNPDMACRIALDYAIYSCDEGKFQARVDAPTYDKLVGILQRVLKGSVEA